MPMLIKEALKKVRDGILSALPAPAALKFDFFMYQRRFLHLNNPVTFNEKIQHRKLCDRDPRLTELSDKILAKEHVLKVLGPEWIIPTTWCGKELPPRSERAWPIPYVLKANHGSGWNLFIQSREDEKWEEIERITGSWLRTTFGKPFLAWAYFDIQPMLLVEPYLKEVAANLTDYKFWVFGGKVELIQVDIDRYVNHKQYFFDRNWKRQAFEYAAPGTPDDVSPPRALDKMIRAAEVLGATFSFVRIDLYEVGGTPLFGEFTFYPNGAHSRFNPESADAEIGKLWPMHTVVEKA
jgi:hypothetical protein